MDFSEIEHKEFEDFKTLARVVYKKIVSLDFPDISAYPPTIEGIIAFEKDLIAGVI